MRNPFVLDVAILLLGFKLFGMQKNDISRDSGGERHNSYIIIGGQHKNKTATCMKPTYLFKGWF